MTVYVDCSTHPLGRMVMCHMIADCTEELRAMASRLGLRETWIQKEGTYQEHFDVCATKRRRAIDLGAVPLSNRKLAELVIARRTKLERRTKGRK